MKRSNRHHITTTWEWVRLLALHPATFVTVARGGKTVINWRF